MGDATARERYVKKARSRRRKIDYFVTSDAVARCDLANAESASQ